MIQRRIRETAPTVGMGLIRDYGKLIEVGLVYPTVTGTTITYTYCSNVSAKSRKICL
jgi:hypothetical protein